MKKTITVKEETWKKLTLKKLDLKAKTIDEVIIYLLKKCRKE